MNPVHRTGHRASGSIGIVLALRPLLPFLGRLAGRLPVNARIAVCDAIRRADLTAPAVTGIRNVGSPRRTGHNSDLRRPLHGVDRQREPFRHLCPRRRRRRRDLGHHCAGAATAPGRDRGVRPRDGAGRCADAESRKISVPPHPLFSDAFRSSREATEATRSGAKPTAWSSPFCPTTSIMTATPVPPHPHTYPTFQTFSSSPSPVALPSE